MKKVDICAQKGQLFVKKVNFFTQTPKLFMKKESLFVNNFTFFSRFAIYFMKNNRVWVRNFAVITAQSREQWHGRCDYEGCEVEKRITFVHSPMTLRRRTL
jgi:hypothetical protein